jgi:hypothetical protein
VQAISVFRLEEEEAPHALELARPAWEPAPAMPALQAR